MHQPEFCPYLGFFGKVSMCDTFMFSDEVQFQNKGFQNRNKIVDWNGNVTYITVPVEKHTHKPIREVKIGKTNGWKEKILNQLKNNYSRCKYFDQIFMEFSDILNKEYQYIGQFNKELIMYFFEKFQLSPNIIPVCDYSPDKEVTEQILEILDNLNCDVYISGAGSKNYMDMNLVNNSNKAIQFYEYNQIKYIQRCKEFVPYMSCLDFLFSNQGTFKNGKLIIK